MTATRVVLNNRNFVLLPESDWAKIAPVPPAKTRTRKRGGEVNGDALPLLPPADKSGNRPALAFADAAIARAIVRRRKRLGLTQIGLANLASVRVEVLNRAERAVTVPSMRTLIKIENVLHNLELRSGAKRARRNPS